MSLLAFINNLGTPELVLIFIVVLLLFGPKSIPKLARSLGQGIREFKDATNKVTESITRLDEEDPKPVARVPREAINRIKGEGSAEIATDDKASVADKAAPQHDLPPDEERPSVQTT
ncbi:twin-arginine translocase TatA/TatE family subunit [Candidatus Sumerlaeota bacterium]|nr:twin-arginine translocase TatA/TatE family subunit [Candidatus Sumerlaeota bacterium]